MKKLEENSVFHLAPSSNFANDFVKGLATKFELKRTESRSDILGPIRILTVNRRSAKTLRSAFCMRGFLTVPNITPLEDLEDFFDVQNVKKNTALIRSLEAPIISKIEKHLILDGLVRQYKRNQKDDVGSASSLDLAKSLSDLIDEINIRGISGSDLDKIRDVELSRHWEVTLDLIKNLLNGYTEALENTGYIDPHKKYLFEVKSLIKQWEKTPYSSPLIIVGSTGSQYATGLLMRAVSQLPQGMVVLPGLDKILCNSDWDLLGFDHPQYSFLHLAKNWKNSSGYSDEILKSPEWYSKPYSKGETSLKFRAKIFSLVMLPAQLTDRWVSNKVVIQKELEPAFKDVSLIEAENIRIEAASICEAISRALNEGSNIAIITPSKIIARTVRSELERLKISPNSYTNELLGDNDLGIFLRQTALAISSKFKMKYLISMLKNINCGKNSSTHYTNTAILCTAVFELEDSFLDLDIDKWVYDQGEDFSNWFCWLKELLTEIKSDLIKISLKRHARVHRSFSEKLFRGCAYNSKGDDNKNTEISIWGSPTGKQILDIFIKLEEITSRKIKYNFLDYRKIFEKIIMEEEINSERDSFSSSVFIWGTLESRMQSAGVYILAGLNEGTWPGNLLEDSWLGRPIRSVIGLDLPERRIGRSAHDFQQATMARKLILSRSLRDDKGLTVCSRWLIRLENFLTGIGDEGITQLKAMRAKGDDLVNAAKGYYSSKVVTESLPESIKCLTRRPAPIPPLSTRPRELSLTDLDTLIRNPYAIYAKKILKLNKLYGVKDQRNAKTKGIIAHKALERFIRKTFQELPNKSQSCALLKSCFYYQIESESVSPELEKVWKKQFDLKVELIVDGELQRRKKAVPVMIETRGRYQISLPKNDIFLITAKVDRIDQGEIGFHIYDYKTGQISKNELIAFSPQLDIAALMFEKGAFTKGAKGKAVEISLIGLGSKPKGFSKNISREDLKTWEMALQKLITRMKQNLSPFYARLNTEKQQLRSNNYDHLSRYGEWLDDHDFCEEKLIFDKRKRLIGDEFE